MVTCMVTHTHSQCAVCGAADTHTQPMSLDVFLEHPLLVTEGITAHHLQSINTTCEYLHVVNFCIGVMCSDEIIEHKK